MGGMARRASALKDYERKHRDRSLLLVETGNAMKQGPNLDDPANRWVIEALNTFGSHAVNTTIADLRRLNRLAELGRIPEGLRTNYVATMVEPSSGSPFTTKPYIVQNLRPAQGGDEIRVGILAVSPVTEETSGIAKVIKPEEALRRYLPDVEANSDVVVLLTRMPDAQLGTLAQVFPVIDVIINGSSKGEGREFEKTGNTVIVESAHGGIGLGLLEIEWDRTGRIQKSANQIIPLPPPMPSDPQLEAIARKAHREKIEYLEEEAKKSPPVTMPSIFAGASSCKDCHATAYKIWKDSRHAHAIDTLKPTGDHFNTECLECHVTGATERSGGFVNFLRTPQLANVQCEACHGPSIKHSQSPQAFHAGVPEDLRKRVRKEFCLRCHTSENSPRFEFESYWKKIAH